MTPFKNVLSALTANWNRIGWLFIAAGWIVAAITHGNFWLGLLNSVLLGAGVFCWGADFQERRTCTRPTESEAN